MTVLNVRIIFCNSGVDFLHQISRVEEILSSYESKKTESNKGRLQKKSDNYHFWGEGGGQRGSFITFFGLKMIFKQF